MALPMVAALTALTSLRRSPPCFVTVSRKPATALFAQFFGRSHALNLILAEDGTCVLSGGQPQTADRGFADLAAAQAWLAADRQMILRFVDPATCRRVEADAPTLFDDSAAVWISIGDDTHRAAVRDRVAQRGFGHRLVSTQPPGELLSRIAVKYDDPPDYTPADQPDIETIVLIDNNLSGARGHYLSVATRIAAGVQQAGLRSVWATNRRLPSALVPKGVQHVPIFVPTIFDLVPEDQAETDFAPALVEGWRALLEQFDAPGTHFLVPTTDGHHVRAVYHLLAEGTRPLGAIHLSTPYETRHMPSRNAGREIDWYLRELVAFGGAARVMLWAETRALGRRLSARLGVTIPNLPLPAPTWAIDLGAAPASGPLRLALLGEARIDKGFAELPEIAAAILRADRTGTELELIVQASPPHGGFDEEMTAVLRALKAMDAVTIIGDPLCDDAYRDLIRSAHGVLLPYRADYYGVRGSGILFEALAAGRVVLASAQTIAEEYVDSGTVMLCDDADSWTRSVRLLLDDRKAMSQDAWRAGKMFGKRYAPRNYIDRLALREVFARP